MPCVLKSLAVATGRWRRRKVDAPFALACASTGRFRHPRGNRAVRALWTALALAATPALALDVPSGQPVTLQEVLVDEVGPQIWLRFRFVAPDIARGAGRVEYDTAADDMTHLCGALALPYLAQYDLTGDVIVISLADRPTTFGQPDPDTTQFFEAYRVENDICIWEGL